MLMTSRPVLALRSILRRFGVTRWLAGFADRRHWRESEAALAEYRARPVDKVSVSAAGATLDLKVANEDEFNATRIKDHDRVLISLLADQLQVGGVLWDIGANIGVYGLLLARTRPQARAHLFDPDPRCQKRLADNRDLNAMTNIEIHNLALSDTRGKMTFELAPESVAGFSRLVDDPSKVDPARRAEVEVWPGDQLRRERGLPQPTAIKIDVEGFERQVIDGLKEILADRACRAVLIEMHFSAMAARGRSEDAGAIDAALRAAGFDQIRFPDSSHLFATKSK